MSRPLLGKLSPSLIAVSFLAILLADMVEKETALLLWLVLFSIFSGFAGLLIGLAYLLYDVDFDL